MVKHCNFLCEVRHSWPAGKHYERVGVLDVNLKLFFLTGEIIDTRGSLSTILRWLWGTGQCGQSVADPFIILMWSFSISVVQVDASASPPGSRVFAVKSCQWLVVSRSS